MKRDSETQKQLEEYELYLEREEKSPATCEKYLRDVQGFLNYLAKEHVRETNVDYMESLSIGGHSIEIVFKDGSAKSEFTVKKNTVNTGFSGTMLSGTAKSKNSVSLKWAKVKNASKYVVYGTKCNSKGNVYKYKKIKPKKAKLSLYAGKTYKIKAKSKGTCNIYAYAQNGVYKKIKLTVR